LNQPLRADQQFVNELLNIAAHGATNDLLMKRYERDARMHIEKGTGDLPMWYLVLCIVSAIQGKIEEVFSTARAATALAPTQLGILGNITSVMGIIGEAGGALPYTRQLAESGNATMVASSVRQFRKALCFEEAAEVIQKRGARDDALRAATVRMLASPIVRDVSVEKRLLMLNTTVSTVRGLGYVIRQSLLRQYGDDGLRYELFIDESPDRCGEVNFDISDGLFERFDDPVPEAITFACRPLTSFEFSGEFIKVAR
jgi:hypothetical protein